MFARPSADAGLEAFRACAALALVIRATHHVERLCEKAAPACSSCHSQCESRGEFCRALLSVRSSAPPLQRSSPATAADREPRQPQQAPLPFAQFSCQGAVRCKQPPHNLASVFLAPLSPMFNVECWALGGQKNSDPSSSSKLSTLYSGGAGASLKLSIGGCGLQDKQSANGYGYMKCSVALRCPVAMSSQEG